MMYIRCPYCSQKIPSVSLEATSSLSQSCSHIQMLGTRIWDCIGKDNFYWNELNPDEARKLLETAEAIGWREALYQYSMAEDPAILNYNKADWFFYLPNTIKTCLDIGSGLGAIPFILSEWVEEVWSLERVLERLEFQAIRAKQERKTNLHFIRSKASPLPFPDNSFDLVSINGVLEWIGLSDFSKNPRDLQRECLQEVHRVLRPGGVVYIGIESRFGLQYLLGSSDHSALPYTSLVPRKLADIMVRKFRKRHPRSRTHPVLWNDYRTYTYTHIGYRRLLRECSFGEIEFCWALPGYSDPRWSGRLDEKESLIFFVQQLDKKEVLPTVLGRLKKLITGILLSSWGKSLISFFISTGLYKFFMPSYIIFAYKGEKQQQSFEEQLKFARQCEQHTHVLPMMYLRRNNRQRETRLTFYGVDKKKQFRELAMMTRFSEHEYLLKKEQQGQTFNSTPPLTKTYSISGRDIIVFQPLKGTKVDFYVEQDIVRSIDWLTDFHKKTACGHWEIQELKAFFHAQLEPIYQTMNLFLDRFIAEMQEQAYFPLKVSEHGDFCTQNILLLNEHQEIYVVDWECYNPRGEEFFDFVKLIVDVFSDYLGELGEKKFQSFAEKEPVKAYIHYFARKQKIPQELIVAYIPLCFGRVAVRHYVQNGKNKYFLRYMNVLEKEVLNLEG